MCFHFNFNSDQAVFSRSLIHLYFYFYLYLCFFFYFYLHFCLYFFLYLYLELGPKQPCKDVYSRSLVRPAADVSKSIGMSNWFGCSPPGWFKENALYFQPVFLCLCLYLYLQINWNVKLVSLLISTIQHSANGSKKTKSGVFCSVANIAREEHS